MYLSYFSGSLPLYIKNKHLPKILKDLNKFTINNIIMVIVTIPCKY